MDKDTLAFHEKLVRAKVALESKLKKHADRCMIELDPDYMGPCTCGASESNAAIKEALGELE